MTNEEKYLKDVFDNATFKLYQDGVNEVGDREEGTTPFLALSDVDYNDDYEAKAGLYIFSLQDYQSQKEDYITLEEELREDIHGLNLEEEEESFGKHTFLMEGTLMECFNYVQTLFMLE